MAGIKVSFEVLNQLSTPTLYSDTLANQPAPAIVGRVFFRTDAPFGIYQDTGTSWNLIANPDTTGITGTGLTGQVPYFTSSSVIAGTNNFFWDSVNNRLGINTTSPGVPLDVHGTGTQLQLNGTGTNNSFLVFQNAGVSEWRIGNNYSSGTNYFSIFDSSNSIESLKLTQSTSLLNSVLSGPTYFKPAVTETAIGATTVTGFNSVISSNTYNASINRDGQNDMGLFIQQTNVYSGILTWGNTGNRAVTYSNGAFTLNGNITQTQPAYILAYSNINARWSPAGTGTIQYLATINPTPDFGGTSVTVTNRYAILINNISGFGSNPIYTNRWSLYQEGTSDNVYFAGKVNIGTSTVGTNILNVNGTSLFSSTVNIGDAVNIALQTTTGTKIGTATAQKIGFWNATPIVQPTTATATATVTINAGTAINTLTTWDGYTIGVVIKALRNAGILA